MTYKVAQAFKYQGKHWWKWSVWIDSSKKDLNQIKQVTYILHPTFSNPVRTTTDRASLFKLESQGWGIFTIRVKLLKADGKTVNLKHELELLYPDGKKCTD